MIATFLGITVAHAAPGRGPGRVVLEPLFATSQPAGVVRLEFRLLDRVTQRPVSDVDLRVTHERKLHLFAFDESLREFRHEHPAYTRDAKGGHWTMDLALGRNGRYRVWTEGTLVSGPEAFTAAGDVEIIGGVPAYPLPAQLGDQRTGVDRGSIVAIPAQVQLFAGETIMVDVRFSRQDGRPPRLSPYLGAPAHVVMTPPQADLLVHVHPMTGGQPNTLMLHTEFPRAGDYRLWIQFVDHGELKVVPLSVRVFPPRRRGPR